jgi:hypothetical protein
MDFAVAEVLPTRVIQNPAGRIDRILSIPHAEFRITGPCRHSCVPGL